MSQDVENLTGGYYTGWFSFRKLTVQGPRGGPKRPKGAQGVESLTGGYYTGWLSFRKMRLQGPRGGPGVPRMSKVSSEVSTPAGFVSGVVEAARGPRMSKVSPEVTTPAGFPLEN